MITKQKKENIVVWSERARGRRIPKAWTGAQEQSPLPPLPSARARQLAPSAPGSIEEVCPWSEFRKRSCLCWVLIVEGRGSERGGEREQKGQRGSENACKQERAKERMSEYVCVCLCVYFWEICISAWSKEKSGTG